MSKKEIRPYYDVCIIGAGIGGLTAAALLSRTGLSVGVFEMDSRPGGYLAGFRRKDFRFDSAIHWLNQCGPNGLVTRVFDLIGPDHPTAKAQKRIRRYMGEHFDYLLTDHPDELKEELIRKFPHEREGLERFFRDAKKIGRSFEKLANFSRSLETMGTLEKLVFNMNRLEFALPFLKHIRFTGPEKTLKGLKGYFQDQKLLDIFCSEEELLSALVPIGWAYSKDFQSPPKGGSQVFPEWLVHVVEQLGNAVHYRCRVKQVKVANGSATGIRMDHRGEQIEVSCKHVIAACDVETLYEHMLPQGAVPQKLLDKLRHADLYRSAVTISLGVDIPVEDLGFNEEMLFLYREDVARTDHNNGDPLKSGISILAPSLRDPSMAPAGKGTITLYCYAHFDQDDQWKTEVDATGQRHRGEAYRTFKQQFAEVLIDRVARKLDIPLKEHIEFCDIATPITHWRYTGNRNGSLMGAKPGKANMRAKVAHHTTPIKDLWLGGHWADLGGGVPIAVKAGMNAALLVLKDTDPRAFKAMARYMDGKLNKENADKQGDLKDYTIRWVQTPTPAEKKAQRLKTGTN